MLVVSILDADSFGDELYDKMRCNLSSIIAMQRIGVVVAAGDSKGMIYRLLCEMAIEYPDVFFTILLSNDKLAYEWSSQILSLDCDIVYGDPRTAKQRRRKTLIERSDIVIARRNYCNDIRELNRFCDIIVI